MPQGVSKHQLAVTPVPQLSFSHYILDDAIGRYIARQIGDDIQITRRTNNTIHDPREKIQAGCANYRFERALIASISYLGVIGIELRIERPDAFQIRYSGFSNEHHLHGTLARPSHFNCILGSGTCIIE